MRFLPKDFSAAKDYFIRAIFAVTAVCLMLGILSSPQNKRPLSIFGYSVYRVTSESMSPKYPLDALVLVKKVKFNSLKVGDTVLYVSHAMNGRFVLHRINRFSEGGFYCKGDNNRYEDNQLVGESAFMGKAVGSLNIYRDIKKILTNPLMLMPFLFMAGFAIKMQWQSDKSDWLGHREGGKL